MIRTGNQTKGRQRTMNIYRHRAFQQDNRSPERREEGQVLVLFALMAFVFVGVLALSLDVGFLMAERRAAQSAADSAVLAAAKGAMDGASLELITETATDYGKSNAGDSAVVNLFTPPVSGTFAGDDSYYQVRVTKDIPKFFVGAVFSGAWYVEADATAKIGSDGFGAGVLALNSNAGGIQTGGYTRLNVTGGSIVSNYNINGSGDTRVTASEWVVANDGFIKAGSTFIQGTEGTNENGPEVVDPLLELLSPPTLPSFPGNPVPTVSPASKTCPNQTPGWWDSSTNSQPGPTKYVGTSGRYTGGGAGCVEIQGPGPYDYVFQSGDYRFQSGAGMKLPYSRIRFAGGRYNFDGGAGISVEGTTNYFEMGAGMYSFTGGASLIISGNAPNNFIGSGATQANHNYFYFSGGGGLISGNTNNVTLYPGTYIFDGGPGISFSGSAQLKFMPGTYEFWFGNGADMKFEGSSRVTLQGNPYVKAYFYGTQINNSDFSMSGSTSFQIPSGEYYFDRGSMTHTGSSAVVGEGVFLYFKNGGRVYSSGSASFAFTALETQIYPGFYPGVYMYSDRANTATFQWFGATSTVSTGIVYLPSSPLVMGGASNGKAWRGQLIADRFILSGSNSTEIEYIEYIPMKVPVVALVE